MHQEYILIQKRLSEEIRLLYIQKFGSIRNFALEVGCDEKTIRNILNLEQNITLKMFFAIARALDVKPDILLKTIID